MPSLHALKPMALSPATAATSGYLDAAAPPLHGPLHLCLPSERRAEEACRCGDGRVQGVLAQIASDFGG